MTDEDIRALVREAVARHLGGPAPAPAAAPATLPPAWRAHPSFGRFLVASGGDDNGPCIIEPAVTCNHCGYCQLHGH